MPHCRTVANAVGSDFVLPLRFCRRASQRRAVPGFTAKAPLSGKLDDPLWYGLTFDLQLDAGGSFIGELGIELKAEFCKERDRLLEIFNR